MNEERSARRRWLAFIGLFFAAQTTLWVWAIAMVSSDPSHAIVADYDARALDWDAQRARADESDALGWRATVEVDRTRVTVRIADAHGAPVAAHDVSVALFHKAEAARRQAPTLHAVAPGVWQGAVDIHREGLWHVELDADRFSTTATVTVTVD